MENIKKGQGASAKKIAGKVNIIPEEGINNWNDRLDQNLEPDEHNDVDADAKAEKFSRENGSGDQSDTNQKD